MKNWVSLFQTLFIAVVLAAMLHSCAIPYTPVQTFEDTQVAREKKIEAFVNSEILQERKKLDVYESLAYGQLIVYKPTSFLILDSLYDVRYQLSKAGKDREIIQLGLDQYIEKQRQLAQADKEELRYEIEHIYSIRSGGEYTITSRYFYLDHKDSVLLASKHYEYTIPRGSYNQLKNYLFEMHFTSSREMYILRNEQQFIQAFKTKEREFIGTREHELFMRHTLQLMEVASRLSTVDYVKLTAALGRLFIAQKAEQVDIVKVDELIALENEAGEIIAYELAVIWWNKANDPELLLKTTIEFDPFLRVNNMTDELMQND
jgi:hypothetical protein